MKKLILAVMAFAALNFTAQAQTGPSIAWTWTNAPQNASFVACSTSVTSACLLNYTLTDTTVSASPVVVSSTIDPTASSYSQTVDIAYGNRIYSLVLSYKDETGTTQTTGAATASLEVHFQAGAPTALSGAKQ